MGYKELVERELARRLGEEKPELAIEKKIVAKKFCVEGGSGETRVMVHGKDGEVRFFSDDGIDITPVLSAFCGNFDLVKKSFVGLEKKGFVLDCGMKRDGKSLYFTVSDVVYLGESVACLPWNRRRQLLNGLSYGEPVKLSPVVVVDSKQDFEKAVALFEKLKDCNKIVVKGYDGKYGVLGESEWVELDYGKKNRAAECFA